MIRHKGQVSDMPLADYVMNIEKDSGVIVARPNELFNSNSPNKIED